jgi:hypothetical protein
MTLSDVQSEAMIESMALSGNLEFVQLNHSEPCTNVSLNQWLAQKLELEGAVMKEWSRNVKKDGNHSFGLFWTVAIHFDETQNS